MDFMRAAILREYDATPELGEFDDPAAAGDAEVAEVLAAGLNPVGIRKASLYHHFRSKEEIVEAVVNDGVRLVLGGVLLVLGRHPHVLRRPDRGSACLGVQVIVAVVSTRQLPRSLSARATSLHRCERSQGRLRRAQASQAPRDGIVAGEGRKSVAENGQEISGRE